MYEINYDKDHYDTLLDKHFDISKQDLIKIFEIENENIKNDTVEYNQKIIELGGVCKILNTLEVNHKFGISDNDLSSSEKEVLKIRKDYYGRSKTLTFKSKELYHCFLDSIKDKTLILLLFIALIRLIFDIILEKDGYFDFISILIAVSIIVLILSFADYFTEEILTKFRYDIQ